MNSAAPTIEDLLAGAERREQFVNPDGRSTAAFERVWIDGAPHVVKYIHPDDDFTMRVSADHDCRTIRAWEAGLLDAAPNAIDHTIVGAAKGYGRDGLGGALLMRDVSDELLALGSATIPISEHERFLDHVTAFCAATWGWSDDRIELLPYAVRWTWFGANALERERALGWPERIPKIAYDGWQRFDQRAPSDIVDVIRDLRQDATPLATALGTTPSCLLHGDVKASNTGAARDGRTILVDWAYVGEGPPCHDLAWHVALDRSKLPVSKENTIDAFRAGLERHGVDTTPWWTRQLHLCLLGALVQFGWEKAFDEDEELHWWCDAARDGARLL